MSAPLQAARPEDQDRLWTIDGLASEFGFTVHQIRKWIENGHVDYGIGRYRHGFNYTHRHYEQLAAIRAKREAAPRLGQKIRRKHRPHVVVVTKSGSAASREAAA